MAFERLPGALVVGASRSALERGGVRPARAGEPSLPSSHTDRRGRVAHFPTEQTYELSPVAGRRTIVRGVRIPPRHSLVGVFEARLPAGWRGTAQFDVVQRKGKRVLGGSTYIVRVR
jgi:hypothetical protein